MKHRIILPLFSVFLSLCSCTNHVESITIYTSFYPVYEFTKRIVGDKMEVINLTPYGTEPHDYELTAKKVAGIYDSKGLFLNGLGLEPFADSLPKSLKKKTYQITEGIKTLSIENSVDPHVWLNPRNAIKEMENILSFMKDIDPTNYSYYQSNYETSKLQFEVLDAELKEIASRLSNKYLLVSHAAFGYLCDAYNLTQISVSGLSPDSEPTGKALEEILSDVKQYHISTIFYEELISSDISDMIAKETGIKTDTLNPLEGLSEEEEKSEDYISVMKENMKKIERASNND